MNNILFTGGAVLLGSYLRGILEGLNIGDVITYTSTKVNKFLIVFINIYLMLFVNFQRDILLHSKGWLISNI
ncbi:MAG: hypothetical protein HRT87_03140 [Legionellales bacterium]|nr:hypothetical protein [Legionellales bacterium]